MKRVPRRFIHEFVHQTKNAATESLSIEDQCSVCANWSLLEGL